MKILVIPDVHLKPQMFKQATALMHQGIADRAVCLMDIPDDWDKQYNVGLYEETYDEAIRFAKAFPETAWCYGNHDLSYLWHCLESGYSSMASMTAGSSSSRRHTLCIGGSAVLSSGGCAWRRYRPRCSARAPRARGTQASRTSPASRASYGRMEEFVGRQAASRVVPGSRNSLWAHAGES